MAKPPRPPEGEAVVASWHERSAGFLGGSSHQPAGIDGRFGL